jgi:predicted permease
MNPRGEPSWRRYLTFWRPSIDRDLEAELRFHFEERVADLVARGRSEADARAEAEGEFGDRETYRARMREIDRRLQARRSRAEWIDTVRGDVRLAWRGMRRAPGLSAMVVVTLALGIGANGAIFSMLDRLYLRPPPGVIAPREVRRIYGDAVQDPGRPVFVRQVFGAEEFRNMARAVGSEHPLAGYNTSLRRLGTADDSPMAEVSDVVGNYFRLLGVRAWRGRVFAEDELTANPAPKVVVLSHRFWRTHFAGDSGVIGREITILREKFRVIGIAEPGFDGIDLGAIDMWRPANLSDPGYGPGSASIRLLTRAGTDEALLRVVKLASDGYDSGKSFTKNTTLRAVPITDGRGASLVSFVEGDLAKRLAGVTLMVLLIAVANVANLLLTRAIERRREIAIRVSLGVSRARLAAQLVTESAVLALIAGAGALLVALWGASLMRRLLLPEVRWADGPLDWRLGVFTLVVALVAGLVASVLPLLRAGRLDLAGSMRGGARDGSAHSSRTRAALIVAQTALSVVLLAGSLLFVRSLRAVQSVDIGFDPAGVIMAQVYSGQQVVPAPQLEAALVAAGERLRGRPGVLSIATSNLEPMAGLSFEELHFPGRDSLPKTNSGPPTFVAVSPEFFRTVGVSVVAGRPFLPSDVDGAPRVMIVTRTMARVAWGAANPIGQCVKVGTISEPCTTVVGVIEDVRRDRVVEDDALMFYLPSAQAPTFARGAFVLLVRAEPAAVEAVEREIRAAILGALPGSRPQMRSFTEMLDPQYRPWRVGASLFTAFGLLALIVAAIGVYSGISYSVTQRSHELGVRMALGAPRARIGRGVVGAGVRVAGMGVVTGIVIALALGRLVESLLYETSPHDPVVLTSVAVILLAIAAIAAALPAWRATRLDPVNVLRAE